MGIGAFDADLWKIADELRANSGLASNEYFIPVMALIFLRQANNRFHQAKEAIEAAAGRMPNQPLVEADFRRRCADVARGGALRLDPAVAQRREPRRGSQQRDGSRRSCLSSDSGAATVRARAVRKQRA